jgi:hypothetical protein
MRQVEPIDFGSGHVVFAQEDPTPVTGFTSSFRER